jgi:predicted hydrocarbon binding protein
MNEIEKQIEEMARDIEKYVVRDWSKELYIGSAEALYNAGYRQVKEIIDKVDDMIGGKMIAQALREIYLEKE